jgi:hypothetical protein
VPHPDRNRRRPLLVVAAAPAVHRCQRAREPRSGRRARNTISAAVERNDRDVVALIKRERLAGRAPVSHGGVVAQVWRGGTGRQVPVARLLAGIAIAALDDGLGRRAGMLLARSGMSDANDAAVVCLAADGDDILTSDAGDLRVLAEAAGVRVELIPV